MRSLFGFTGPVLVIVAIAAIAAEFLCVATSAQQFSNAVAGEITPPALDVVCPATRHVFPAHVEHDAPWWWCSRCWGWHETPSTRFAIDGVIQTHLLDE